MESAMLYLYVAVVTQNKQQPNTGSRERFFAFLLYVKTRSSYTLERRGVFSWFQNATLPLYAIES